MGAVLFHLSTAVSTLAKSRKRKDNAFLCGLALTNRFVHLPHLVPKLLRNDRLVIVFGYSPLGFVLLDYLVIFVAHRSCVELNKMSEIGVVVKDLPYRLCAPHMSCTARIRFSELGIIVV